MKNATRFLYTGLSDIANLSIVSIDKIPACSVTGLAKKTLNGIYSE
jgi:hypothetical protein